jgi:DNA-binding transcriptional LysR family regulator
LTAAGERMSEHAAHILLRLDVAASELASFSDEPPVVRIAMTPLAIATKVAAALRHARRERPALYATLVTTTAAVAAADVARGAADIAIVDGVVAPGNPLAVADAGLLASFAVHEEGVSVIVPAAHPFRAASIDLDALTDAQWIDAPLLGEGPASVPGWSGPAAAPKLRYLGADVVTALELVAGGHGLALMPKRVAATVHGVRAVEIAKPRLVHRTELLVLKNGVDRHRSLIEALRI